jgi:predicted transcriptional regulator
MALVFDNRNIQIKFFSNKTLNSNLKKELVVYPVLAHKIYAPVIDDLKLNIFQKYILSILNKGNFSFDKISEWLSLDIVLVKTIAAELANKGLIDINTMDITNKGKELIEGTFSWFNNAEDLKKDIRYVFQDVFTQELYPIVLPFDNFQENVWLEKGQLVSGTKGKKDSFHYELIMPGNINLNKIRKPESEEILDTLNKQIKKYTPDSKNDIKELPNAVSYIGEEPDLLYCAMWISSEQNNKQEDNIEVSDPFNIYDEAYWLRNIVLKAKKEDATLKEVIHNLIYNIEEEEKSKVSEFMRLFDIELEKEINQKFDFTLKTEYSNLYLAIKEYFFDIKFYELHKDATHLKNSFRKSQIVLETFFKIIYEKFKDDYDDVISSQTYNGARFHVYKDEIITKIKQINTNAEIPNWHHHEFKDVYNALRNPDRASLRALFIASVMASFYNNEIPIYKILQAKSNTPICIENIAESRNKVGHKYIEIPDNEIDKYFEDVKTMRKDIEEIIQIFLNN